MACTKSDGSKDTSAHLSPEHADTFRRDLRADYMPDRKDSANPPCNVSDWFRQDEDVRCCQSCRAGS